jgi:putative transposase
VVEVIYDNRYTSNQIEALSNKRNRRVRNYLHPASRQIVDHLREQIGVLVVGKNDGWKQEVNMGRKNNQAFVSIPNAQFIRGMFISSTGQIIHADINGSYNMIGKVIPVAFSKGIVGLIVAPVRFSLQTHPVRH